MILIDALYINGGGGKVLLDYLIFELEKTDKEITFLLDERIKNKRNYFSEKNTFIFMEADLKKRSNFYKKNKSTFSSILCFGNLPPNIRTKAKVYTYFHQSLYLDLPDDMNFVKKGIYKLKTLVVRYFKPNTDFWIVQNELVQNSLSKKYAINKSKIKILPFYPSFLSHEKFERKRHQYIYVSDAPPHKNHLLLIEAFCAFYDKFNIGRLVLTVSEEFLPLVEVIKEKVKLNYPIENIGFVQREKLQQYYSESHYHIFPSISESFGLGLVEAIENGCDIIGADLPYTYEVCEPSIAFNPFEVNSILDALTLSMQNNIPKSTSKVKNQIEKIIDLL